MRVRTDRDRINSFIISSEGETNTYGEMMKAFYRTEKAKIPVADYTGITKSAWLAKRKALLKALAEMVGPFPSRKVPLKAKVNRKFDRGDYTVEGVSFYTRPNWPVSSLFYLPKKRKGKVPGVLMVHGHSFAQKAANFYQKVAINLVKNGYAVLAVDFVGGGERKPQGHEANYLLMAGQTVQGIMIWDNMRAIDYLTSRKEVNASAIGITGSSGGGNQSAFTTVFDERITASAPVNAPCMFDEHMTVGIDNFCPCEVLPNIWNIAEYSDMMATVAPRALILSQAVKDRLFPIKGVRELYNRAREVYKALGVPDKIEIQEDYGPHNFSFSIQVGIIRFFEKHLKGVEPKRPEAYNDFITAENDLSEVLFAFPGGKLPAKSGTLGTLYASLTEKLPETKRPKTKAAYGAYKRKVLSHLSKLAGPKPEARPLDIEEYPEAYSSWANMRPFSFESELGITIPSLLIEPKAKPASRIVLYANSGGKGNAVMLRNIELMARDGAAVVAMDMRGTGETGGTMRGHGVGFVVHRSIMLGRHISMMRAYDISKTVDAIRTFAGYERFPVYVWGDGEASMYALLACALDRRIKRLATTGLLLSFKSDSGFACSDAILPPGMLKGADVSDIIAACLDREVLVGLGQLADGKTATAAKTAEMLKAAFDAAKAGGLTPPEIASGGYESTESAIRKFLS